MFVVRHFRRAGSFFVLVILSMAVFFYATTVPATVMCTSKMDMLIPKENKLVINISLSEKEKKLVKNISLENIVIATGANSVFFQGLSNLVGSIHFWAPNASILVFDLGLSNQQVEQVKSWCNVHLEKFNFSKYPSFITDLHKFAWKPICISEALTRHHSIIWTDAGSDIRGPLDPVISILKNETNFFVQGQDGDLTFLLVDGTFKYLNKSRKDFCCKPSFAGGLSAWIRGSRAYEYILKPWVRCALVKECIAPPGASLRNHRFDQSVLSILIHSSTVPVIPHTELVDNLRKSFNKDNKTPSKRVFYTARKSSKEYLNYLKKNVFTRCKYAFPESTGQATNIMNVNFKMV